MARILLIAFLALTACQQQPFPFDDTVFRCDAQHGCPDGYECNETAGVCRELGLHGCADQLYTREWLFEISKEDWQQSVPDTGVNANLAWTSDAGYPDRGALGLDFRAATAGSRIAYVGPSESDYGDLTGKTLSMRLWADAPIVVTLFIQSGTGENLSPWSETGATMLPANQWTCATLDADAAFRPSGFDIAHVTRLGFQLELALDAGVPVHVLVDDVGY